MDARTSVQILLVAGLAVALTSCNGPATTKNIEGKTVIHGAGATFPAPLYKKWIEEYEKSHRDTAVSYELVGSGEGQKRFFDGQVDFGASDAALSDEQIAQVKRGVQLIPTLAGKVVIAYNLEGLGGELRLKRDVYTDIFLGKIKRWNDERIAELNPGLKLPDSSIHVIARQDGSGTTFAFTNHLAAISPEWKSTRGVGNKLGSGKASLATGNEGVAALIQRTPGGIGYVEYGMAKRTGLAMAELENKAGHFVAPSGSSGLATLANTKLPDNLRAFFPDPEGSDSYPIVTYTWLLLYQEYGDPKKAAAVKSFVRWCLTDGQSYNEALGFIRLTPQVANAGLEALNGIR